MVDTSSTLAIEPLVCLRSDDVMLEQRRHITPFLLASL